MKIINKINRKKIAILYISTGQYITLWESFYTSIKKYFLKNHQIHFFLWTDLPPSILPSDVTYTQARWKKWPSGTLDRYFIFLQREKELLEYDYCFFFNANMHCVKDVDEDILPTEEVPLVAVEHMRMPFMEAKERLDLLKTKYWSNRPKSAAFMPFKTFSDHPEWSWLMGGLNGGTTKAWVQMSKCINSWILYDKRHNIKMKWNDEAYMNKYMILNGVKRLNPQIYMKPHYTNKPVTDSNVKIILQSKNKLISDDFRIRPRHVDNFLNRIIPL